MHHRQPTSVQNRCENEYAPGTAAGRRELMPEALDMCDNFTALKELQLFSPLEDTPVEDLQVCCRCLGSPLLQWACFLLL